MTINRKVFYAYARKAPFGGRISQQQVDGIEPVLQEWEKRAPHGDLRWLAYILAGVFHETGTRMVPVREGFASTDGGAVAAVTKLFKAGKIKRNYALPDAKGRSWFGRGRIQNTHEENYRRIQQRYGVPAWDNPSILLQSGPDAIVTVQGHLDGIWTGKRVGQFFTESVSDPKGARAIVNGTDKAALIATYYEAFLSALRAATAPTLATVAEAEAIEPPAKASIPAKRVPAQVVVASNPDDAGTVYEGTDTAASVDPAPVVDGVPLTQSSTMWGIGASALGGLLSAVVAAVNSPYGVAAIAILAVVIVGGALIAFRGRINLRYEKGV